jgi:hypothetical protein
MKYIALMFVIVGLVMSMTTAEAVTVYLKDGTRLEVEKVTRLGNSVCLLVNISKIDTTKTVIEDFLLEEEKKTVQEGLAITNAKFLPSDDNTEIIMTGQVENHTQNTVKNLQVTAILMDKADHVLLKVLGYVHPEQLSPGQTGTYRFQVKKPKGFWKASVDVQSEAVQP